jgi:putative transposase
MMPVHGHSRAAVLGPSLRTGTVASRTFLCSNPALSGPLTGLLSKQVTAMSKNYYSEINLHITWHTKDSLPLLNPRVEPLAHRSLKQRIVNTPGAFVHEIGGTETHVHLAVTTPPVLTISELIGQLKGASAHEVNEEVGMRDKTLQWQTGYGVVSFGTRQLPWVKDYIRRQREHHESGTTEDRLERITALDT